MSDDFQVGIIFGFFITFLIMVFYPVTDKVTASNFNRAEIACEHLGGLEYVTRPACFSGNFKAQCKTNYVVMRSDFK